MFSEPTGLRQPQAQSCYRSGTTRGSLISQSPKQVSRNAVTPFVPARASRASRKISWRSRGSCRGSIVVKIAGNSVTLTFESLLELMVIMLFVGRNDVVDIWDQPPAIEYRDSLGRRRKHTFDFRVVLETGEQFAIAVKPSYRADRPSFQAELSRIAGALPAAFADEVILVTDRDFTRAQTLNAARFFEFSKVPDVEADAANQTVIDRTKGAVPISSIVAETGLGGRAYRSVVRAIFQDRLRQTIPALISPGVLVRPTQKMGA